MSSYWATVTAGRLRRRALIAGSLSALGAAALVAGCGGDDGPTKGPGAGLLAQPSNTTSKAAPGGTFKGFIASDPATLDPMAASTVFAFSWVAHYAYPRLIKFKAVEAPAIPGSEFEGDLVESFELSGDKLQLTLRLRQGLSWDPRPPTNGRAIVAEDVVASFNRFAKVSPYRADLVYSTENPASPIESVSATDSRTVVVKTKQPNSSLLELLGASLFFVLPREQDGGFNPKTEVRGYGPWMLEDYRPSAYMTWRKNPDYYVKGRPFPDRLENPIVSEYAAQLGQFRAGSIYAMTVKSEDILPTKRDLPDLVLQQDYAYPLGAPWLGFGYEGDSPFKDERVRLAVSNLINREEYYASFSNRDRFEVEGLSVPGRYNTVVASGWEGYWLDPTDARQFGPHARYLQHDVAEAKKLLAAAGHAAGIDTVFHYPTTVYPADHVQHIGIFQEYLRAGGLRSTLEGHEYAQDYLPKVRFAYASSSNRVGYRGLMHAVDASRPTVALQIAANFHKDGARFRGATPNGLNAGQGDPHVNSLIDGLMAEFDQGRQRALVHEFIRYATGKGYTVPSPYMPAVLGFNLSWPVIGNYGYFRTSPGGNPVAESNLHHWIDSTKAPLARP